MKKAFLTIDWDYFVPENPLHDFAHTENQFFLGDAWTTRGIAWKNRTNGLEQDFWKKFDEVQFNPAKTHVSDSHLDAWDNPHLHRADVVVLVDRHHDAYSLPSENFHCGNWLIPWLQEDPKREVIWVPPPDVLSTEMNLFIDRYEIDDEFDFTTFDYTGVHICRSGCWTMPWLDAAFVRFVNARPFDFGLHATRTKEWCDPMVPRWTLRDYRAMFANMAATKKLMDMVTASGRFVL